VVLRRTYPGGVLAREYDAHGQKSSSGKYINNGESAKRSGKTSMVYPVCEVEGEGELDGDLEGGMQPEGFSEKQKPGGAMVVPEGCEMVGRAGGQEATAGCGSGAAEEGTSGKARAGVIPESGADGDASPQEGTALVPKKPQKDSYCEMCLDELSLC
jgi:hypothetical protein